MGNIGHDRLFVRPLYVNVLRVQKPGDSKFSVGNLAKNSKVKLVILNGLDVTDREGGLKANKVGLVAHGFKIDNAWERR